METPLSIDPPLPLVETGTSGCPRSSLVAEAQLCGVPLGNVVDDFRLHVVSRLRNRPRVPVNPSDLEIEVKKSLKEELLMEFIKKSKSPKNLEN